MHRLRSKIANAKKGEQHVGNYLNITKIQNGDHTEFTKMYCAYVKNVQSYVYRKTKNKDDVQEIVQDIFADVWRKKKSIHSHAIIWTIAKRKCIDFFRKKRTHYLACEKLDSTILHSDLVEKQEWWTNFLQKLSQKERDIVCLLLQGYERKEIANILNISSGTVDTRLHRLKKKFST
ncbi:RNA polymerase sigma factor [Candidatus Uabimicrobium sp. HlEnr_7]|uniref:RNA polymerase sigma factor n=1 Tax=Candidatus Uabimicrobium helgolandensis TaxID=3095367 RepID=UPI003557FD11